MPRARGGMTPSNDIMQSGGNRDLQKQTSKTTRAMSANGPTDIASGSNRSRFEMRRCAHRPLWRLIGRCTVYQKSNGRRQNLRPRIRLRAATKRTPRVTSLGVLKFVASIQVCLGGCSVGGWAVARSAQYRQAKRSRRACNADHAVVSVWFLVCSSRQGWRNVPGSVCEFRYSCWIVLVCSFDRQTDISFKKALAPAIA